VEHREEEIQDTVKVALAELHRGGRLTEHPFGIR
jgi:hypothetical protein